MKSVLSFKRFDVLETIYRFNPSIELDSEDVTPKLSLKIRYQDEDRKLAALIFSIELGDVELSENTFYIKVVVVGLFSLELEQDANSNDLIDDMYKKNAVAILYPYIRSIVTDLSSKGSENPIILPPLNVAAMIDEDDLTIEEKINEKIEEK